MASLKKGGAFRLYFNGKGKINEDMEQKLISIIIPVYNAENFLDECFGSLSGQTYKNLEIIFVDDGSTDNSYKKCLGYAGKDSRVKVYTKRNGGQNSARKLGIENATGEYIGFVDADDWIDSRMYEKMLNKINEYSTDVVICGLNKVYGNGRVISQTPSFSGVYEGKSILTQIFDENNLFHANISLTFYTTLSTKGIVKKSIYEIDERIDYAEDYAWFTVVCLNSSKIYVMWDSLYFYRRHNSSVSGSHSKSNALSQKYLYNNISEIFKQWDVHQKAFKQLGYVIVLDLLMGGYDFFLKKYCTLFPYNVPRKSKIIIYGAGKCGAEIYAKVKKSKAYEIVAWVDKNWKMYNSKSILPIERIEEFEVDYIVVAIANQSVSRQVQSNLTAMGIEEKKIRIMDLALIECEVSSWCGNDICNIGIS